MSQPDQPGAFMPMPGRTGMVAGSVPGFGLATRWWGTAAALVRSCCAMAAGSRGEFVGAGAWSVVEQGLSGENSGKMGIFLITNRKD